MEVKSYVKFLATQPQWVSTSLVAAAVAGLAAAQLKAPPIVVVLAMAAGAASALWLREQAPVGIVPPITTQATGAGSIAVGEMNGPRYVATGAPPL